MGTNKHIPKNLPLLDFSLFYSLHPDYEKKIPVSFLEWFVGFVEGDGSLVVNSRQNLTFVVTQGTGDIQVLRIIQETLGFGNVISQGKTVSRYVVHNLTDLYKILCILNGNLILPSRQTQFLKMVSIFNQKVQKHPKGKRMFVSVVEPKPFAAMVSQKNGWFSGFMDAEGCFTVSFLRGSATFRIRCLVSQKGKENLPFLSSLILMFQTGVIELHSKINNYSFIISGAQNCCKVYAYFEAYPLRTKKNQSFLLWKEIHQEILKQNHLDTQVRQDLIQKAKEINPKKENLKLKRACRLFKIFTLTKLE